MLTNQQKDCLLISELASATFSTARLLHRFGVARLVVKTIKSTVPVFGG
jgi:hypothetical protein